VSLEKIKLFISPVSCPILVLTTVLGRPRRSDGEKFVKNYQVTTTRENTIPFFKILV
jgi:hypothetical protein